jgi:hypothetical protein
MDIEDRPQGDCIRSRKEFAQRINVTVRTLDRMDPAEMLPPKAQISECRAPNIATVGTGAHVLNLDPDVFRREECFLCISG